MITKQHESHCQTLTAHNNCRECRADTERRFVSTDPWHYGHVHDYLNYIAPRLDAIHTGTDTIEARRWLRDFRVALDRRISLKAGMLKWRKLCPSYLERLNGMRHVSDAKYLRNFARCNASALT